MSLATSNRDGGRTSESGHLRAFLKGFKGQVQTGLQVSQRGAGANMSVDIAIGDALIPRSDGTYGHPAWNDAVYNQVIATADVSNPRRDIVVLYIDYGQTPSTGVSNNTNGVVKIKVVAGTPAGSPADPTDAAIQTSVTAGNPFVKLARVRVAAGAGSITNSVIDDLRIMATGIQQGGWIFDDLYTWVYASATTFTVAGVDVTAQFPVGAKIALYQSGAIKYFSVAASAFSTNTTVTLNGAVGSYSLTNVPIDRPAFSYASTPSGFPAPVLPFNPYKFSVYRTTALTTAVGFQKLVLDTEQFDTNNNFASGTFTAPVSGFYQFNWLFTISIVSTSNDTVATLYKNGVVETWGTEIESQGGTGSSDLLQLTAGDTIEMWVYTQVASAIIAAKTSTRLSGYLISRA